MIQRIKEHSQRYGIVTAVSSVAGILSLLGENLHGTMKLRDFFSDMTSASRTIARFLYDIDSLIQTIQAVNDLVARLPEDCKDSYILDLHIQLENYSKDVSRWVTISARLRPDSDVGLKMWFKKF